MIQFIIANTPYNRLQTNTSKKSDSAAGEKAVLAPNTLFFILVIGINYIIPMVVQFIMWLKSKRKECIRNKIEVGLEGKPSPTTTEIPKRKMIKYLGVLQILSPLGVLIIITIRDHNTIDKKDDEIENTATPINNKKTTEPITIALNKKTYNRSNESVPNSDFIDEISRQQNQDLIKTNQSITCNNIDQINKTGQYSISNQTNPDIGNYDIPSPRSSPTDDIKKKIFISSVDMLSSNPKSQSNSHIEDCDKKSQKSLFTIYEQSQEFNHQSMSKRIQDEDEIEIDERNHLAIKRHSDLEKSSIVSGDKVLESGEVVLEHDYNVQDFNLDSKYTGDACKKTQVNSELTRNTSHIPDTLNSSPKNELSNGQKVDNKIEEFENKPRPNTNGFQDLKNHYNHHFKNPETPTDTRQNKCMTIGSKKRKYVNIDQGIRSYKIGNANDLESLENKTNKSNTFGTHDDNQDRKNVTQKMNIRSVSVDMPYNKQDLSSKCSIMINSVKFYVMMPTPISER